MRHGTIFRAINLIIMAAMLAAPFSAPAAGNAAAAQPAAAQPLAYSPDRLLVKFSPGKGLESLGLDALGVLDAQPLLGAWGQIYQLTLIPGSDVQATAEQLADGPGVLWAEPDYLAYPAATTPNDPEFPDQWGLDKINAPEAWDVTTGTNTVVIAIVDSGVDFSHPDLAGKLWVNPGEIAANGLDDDNNGYVDDVNGWDFVNGDNNPADDNGHGTQVAGIAAAATDNAIGIAGACWNCRILPVKVMQAGGVANYSAIAQGVLYAAQKGAKVINLSLGGYSYSNALLEAVQSATQTYGALLVGGAGNDGVSTPFYPAAYEDVIAVAGTDQNDLKASFSDYGSWVDVSAPAVAITTTFMGGDYGAVQGTSYAAAFVSGQAGLIWSQYLEWSQAVVGAQIYYTADVIDALNPAYAGQLGSGRINAHAAVTTTPTPLISLEATTVNGDPLGRPTPGESAVLGITLANAWLGANNVNGTLSTADSYVTITQANASFGSISSGGSAAGSPDFAFDVAAGAGYDHPIPFALKLTANGGYAATINFVITTRGAEEQVWGTIGSDTIWTNDKTYIVMNNVGVAPGVTLTIQAGTDVRFNGSYNLNVGGQLVADGTETQPIRFLSNTGNTWGRIYFDDTSLDATTDISGTYQAGNILRWVTIEGASQGIGCNNATPYLSHMMTDGGGVSCAAGNTPVWLVDSDVTGDVTLSGVPNAAWRTRANMPTARGHLGVAAASNGKLYAIGGRNNGTGTTDATEEYDPATDTWTTRASMPTPRWGLGVAAANNGKIYAIGGYGGLTTVEEYDPAMDTWTPRASMPTPRGGLGVAAASNGKLYAIGGAGGSATVEEYDPATDTWTTRASMPTPRESLGVVAASNGKVYAIGGIYSDGLVEEYDPATDTWTTRASMSTPREYLGVAAASNGKIYAIGGTPGDYLVEEYDPAADTWTIRSNMPTPRWGLGVAAASNGKLYAIGGENSFNYLAAVEEYEPTSFTYGSFNIWNTTIRTGNLSTSEDSRVLDSTVCGSISADQASMVQNTVTSGSISLGSGTVQNATVTGGDISIGSGQVLSNTLTGGGISAGSGSLVQGNNIENAPGWAIQGAGTVTGNRLVGNASGIQASGGLVQGNLVANGTGIGLEISGDVTVISNTFTNNISNTIVIQSGAPTIQGNNLEGNTGTYEIENLTPNDIPAEDNWWGDGVNIPQRIFDYYDEYTYGKVLYTSTAIGPVQTAPAYVRSVTLTPKSPVGIETVTFDVEFSRPMDTEAAPQISFQSVLHNTWTVYDTGNSELPHDYVYAIVADPDGSLWFGTELGGVAHFDSGNWTIYNTNNSGLLDNEINDIAIDKDGAHWFATGEGGVAHFDGTTWAVYNTENSEMPVNLISSIVTDQDGSVWFGTIGGGVVHFDGANWVIYNTSNSELPSDTVTAIATDRDGSHWFTTYHYSHGGELAHYDGADWHIYTASNSGLPPASVLSSIAVDPNGALWIGSSNMGVAYFDGTNWKTYTSENSELPENSILAIAIGKDGTPWFGTSQGVANLNGSNWVLYNPDNPDSPGGNVVMSIATGVDDSHWFGTGDGVRVLWNYSNVTVQGNPFWLDATHFQASYDITALITRGDYRITVARAVGTDGIEIAPNTDTTFTVDYTGAVGDTTPPLAPTATACAGDTSDHLYASWMASDPDSAITLYQYAIGTTPGGADVVNWTNATDTSFERSGLGLAAGQDVYVSVRARNAGGLWSEAATTPALVAGSGTCVANMYVIVLPVVQR